MRRSGADAAIRFAAIPAWRGRATVASTAIMSVAMATAVTGQVPAGDEPANAPRYNVELIVFRHQDQSINTEETWQPIVPEPVEMEPDAIYGDPFDLMPAEVIAPEIETGTTSNRLSTDSIAPAVAEGQRRPPNTIKFFLLDIRHQAPRFVRLPESRFELGMEYERLELLDAYQPLLHLVWNQAAYAKDQALPFDIPQSAAESSGVSGIITVYKDRFLHLGLNLEMTEASTDNVETNIYDTWRTPIWLLDDPPMSGNQVQQGSVFSLQESRRIRGNLLQYFDHPKFGVIVKISRVNTQAVENPGQG